VKLITQPDDGIAPLLKAVNQAKSRIDLVIFRFDLADLEAALKAAVGRGVVVRALVAHTNKKGEKKLRKLEQRLLGYGVTVDRTPDELRRYHGKLLVVDSRRAFIMGFNFTRLDIRKSRSFGVETRQKNVVLELLQLIASDADRQAYFPKQPSLVISPENSRAKLSQFIKKARQELLIYDPNLNDDSMIRLIKARAAAGVQVRIIGRLEKKWQGKDLPHEAIRQNRLHVRAIVRDRRQAFVGSQSLRKPELDRRREVGILLRERKMIKALVDVFEADWALTPSGKSGKTPGKKKSNRK
jgi:cardiolipin synthase